MKTHVKKWEQFFDFSVGLIQENPIKTRIIIKYNQKNQSTIIKVTDDKKYFIYNCKNEDEFKNIEQFVNYSSQILSNLPDEVQNEKMDIEVQKEDKKKKNKKRA